MWRRGSTRLDSRVDPGRDSVQTGCEAQIVSNGLEAGWPEVSSSSAKRVESEAGLPFLSIFIHAPANAHSLYNIKNHPYTRRGRQCATSRKVAGSNPDEVFEIFY